MAGRQDITSGGKERQQSTVELYVPVFATDPLITYFLYSLPDQDARLSYLPAYFGVLIKAAALNGGIFDEINGYEACSVLMPPGRAVDNTWTLLPAGFLGCLWKLGVGGCKRMLLEYEPLTKAVKAKVLKKGEKHFYVFFIGTREDCRGRGLASALIRYHQAIAATEGHPIWLEATTAHSRDIYGTLGFETVDEIVLGKGKVAPTGLKSNGGEGVKVWGMIWRPELSKEGQLPGQRV